MFRMILYKQLTKKFFNLIGNGKGKIERLALINYIEYGGLKMLDLESMILAQRTMCLKKYIEDYASPWKTFLSYYLEKVGGKFILQCHFDCSKLPVSMPAFYKDCLNAWSTLTEQEACSYGDIMNQFVWNNKYILSDGKSLYHAFFHNTCGISKAGDLISKDNIFLGSEKILNAKLTPSQYFFLMGVVSALPNEWRSTIKGKSAHIEPDPFIDDSFQVPIRGEMVDLSSISQKHYTECSVPVKKFLRPLKLN